LTACEREFDLIDSGFKKIDIIGIGYFTWILMKVLNFGTKFTDFKNGKFCVKVKIFRLFSFPGISS
jgi:hypothetical protein